MPDLKGFSHVDLTVLDCRRAAEWWHDVLGFALVHQTRGDTFECMAMVHPSGIAVTVMTHDDTAEYGAFDERRVGLDHLGFRVAGVDELQRWVVHLDAKAVTHTGIIDTGYGPTVVFRDRDGIQLEFFVHELVTTELTEAGSPEARSALETSQGTG